MSMPRVPRVLGSVLLTGAALTIACSSPPPASEAPAPAADAAAAPAAAPRAEQALLDDLAVANRIMARQLAILDVQGHVTARSLTNPNHYYIARFIGPGDVVTSDFIENDLDSKPVDGPRNDQAREIYLHGEIFKARPDIMAIVHSHTQEFVAFGLSSVPLWNGDRQLPVFDLRPFNYGRSGIIFTPALGKAMAEKMGDAEAVLLWGHGIAIGAKSIPEVITRVAQLRDSAQAQQAVVAAGGTWKPQPRPVNEQDVQRTWAYHKGEVIRQMGGTVLRTAPAASERPSDPVALARRDVVLASRILASSEVEVLDTVGHISVRHPGNPNAYFVAPNVAAGAVTPADVIERDASKREADTLGLSIHDEIYTSHPEVGSVLYARTPAVVAFTASVPLRATVNGGNFIGDGLPLFNLATLDAQQPVLANPALGKGVAAALNQKGGVLLSQHGWVLTGRTIYNVTERAYQVRQNARIQQLAMALRGRVTYLSNLPGYPAPPPEAPSPTPPGQQLGPPEGRGWVYWAGNVRLDQ